MLEIRQRQQEQINAAAAKYAEEQKLKNEQKTAERLEEWERFKEGGAYRSKLTNRTQPNNDNSGDSPQQKPTDKKPKLRQTDYNPLTGSSGPTCSCRPSRRNVGGG